MCCYMSYLCVVGAINAQGSRQHLNSLGPQSAKQVEESYLLLTTWPRNQAKLGPLKEVSHLKISQFNYSGFVTIIQS